ncbi:MAG TPA: response regulator [Verrucomicrobiae bacterium]
MKILLAEDNPDDVFLMQQALKKAGVPILLHPVFDGLEVMAFLKAEAAAIERAPFSFPDLLLLDLNLPRANGFEVLEWIRQDDRCSRLTVHVLSASTRQLDVQRAYDLCANSYVIKPTRLDELLLFLQTLHHWHRFTALPQCTQAAHSAA